MAVLRALERTPGALVRNPVIFLVFGLFSLVQVPQLLAQAVDPLVAGLVSLLMTGVLVFVTPFVQAGAMKMADEGLDGRTSLGSFVAAGKANYLSVLGAYLVVFGVGFVLGVVGFFVAVIGGVFAFGAGSGGLGTSGLLLLVLVGGSIVLAYLAFAFFVQFYVQEIVLNGASAIESFTQSAGLVRRNILSTLGYFVVVLVGSLVVGGGIGVFSLFVLPSGPGTTMATRSLATTVVYAIVNVVGITVIASVFTVYAVAFWRELRGSETRTGPAVQA